MYGVKLHVWGDYACFTRPEMKVERVSYDVITPSAARGVLEAIYWKPEITWVIDRLHVLKPIRFAQIRRNEVGCKASAANARAAMRAGTGNIGIYVEEKRQQRAATVLKSVAYLIDAHFDITGGQDNAGKHLDIFNRRVAAGQCFQRPYLGCREFAAHFGPVIDATESPPVELAGERDLGFMLHDIDFKHDMMPRFFRAKMRNGVIDVPAFPSGEVPS
ncbi:MAG: type I-C CRISPR-associated protein Cas5c [Planctomycetota bacterium]|nr:type I-C CRISPR-associated protein Cas5c [Planctomycetota bacterium]